MHLTVGREYATIQETLQAIPYEERAVVTVPAGVYHEKIFSDHRDLTLEGAGEDRTSIIFEQGAKEVLSDGRKRGTFRTATAFFSGERLVLKDLNVSNYAGVGFRVGQAIALYLDVRKARLSHVHVNGFQDTLFLGPLPEKEREPGGFLGPRAFAPRLASEVVVEHSVVSGDIDFIFGGADALFHDCVIKSVHPGYVCAPCGFLGHERDRGFVFHRCSFVAEVACDESACVAVMRPWRPEGRLTTINCTFGPHIIPSRVTHWKGLEDDPLYWDHYQSGAADNTIDERQVMALVSSFGA